MRLTRGAVVIASIGEPSGKPRPFVVIRSGHFAEHSLVTLMAFTSALTEAPLLRVTVEPSPQNGLGTTSQAMIDHIQSVRLQRIGEVVGQLADADLQAITRAMAIYLGLADPSPRAQRRAVERPA